MLGILGEEGGSELLLVSIMVAKTKFVSTVPKTSEVRPEWPRQFFGQGKNINHVEFEVRIWKCKGDVSLLGHVIP